MSGWLEKWEQTNYRNMKIASISVFILLAIYMTVIHNFNYLKKGRRFITVSSFLDFSERMYDGARRRIDMGQAHS